MGIGKTIKNLIFFEKDDDFFDKEATIKEYFSLVPPENRKKVNNYDELYEEALKYINRQSFKENTADIENYFYELDDKDITIGVMIGIAGYIIATEVDTLGTDKKETFIDSNGNEVQRVTRKSIENKINEFFGKGYDENNPFDIAFRNPKHRDFGHDIFTFGFKNIPNDYAILLNGKVMQVGKLVGKQGNISMLDIIWKIYGEGSGSKLKGIFNCLNHTLVHFVKDLSTKEGISLPFSSLFYDYQKRENKFNRQVDKVNGNMKLSDFASLGFIEGICKFYVERKNLGVQSDSVKRDLKVISMGTCIILQMSKLVFQDNQRIVNKVKGRRPMLAGAKLNTIMTGVMLKNMMTEMKVIVKARKEVNDTYKQQLKKIGESTYE